MGEGSNRSAVGLRGHRSLTDGSPSQAACGLVRCKPSMGAQWRSPDKFLNKAFLASRYCILSTFKLSCLEQNSYVYWYFEWGSNLNWEVATSPVRVQSTMSDSVTFLGRYKLISVGHWDISAGHCPMTDSHFAACLPSPHRFVALNWEVFTGEFVG